MKAASDTRTNQLVPMEFISENNLYDQNSNELMKNNLIHTHFPIVNIEKDSITSSSKLPTVSKQTDTFLHRIVNNFFSITNTKEKKKKFSRTKRKHSKTNKTKHCNICRKYRNYFSILSTDSLDNTSAFNTNAARTTQQNNSQSNSLQKTRRLNQSQCQTIASAVELIFDTLISNYNIN